MIKARAKKLAVAVAIDQVLNQAINGLKSLYHGLNLENLPCDILLSLCDVWNDAGDIINIIELIVILYLLFNRSTEGKLSLAKA